MLSLPPAVDLVLEDERYELKRISTPVLRGWRLWLFRLLTRTPMWHVVYRVLSRKSGMPQALREVVLPEAPTFLPVALENYATKDAELCKKLAGDAVQAEGGVTAVERLKLAENCLETAVSTSTAKRASIRDYHAAYASGRANPVEVVQSILQFLDARNDKGRDALHWFLFYGTNVLEAAQQSAERWRNNTPLSLLDGVPFAVKDSMDVAEYPTCSGTQFLHKRRPTPGDAAPVAALKAAGAILIGKTTMHELGMSTLGINPHHGSARNPWATAHVSGGSSAGSAAVVGAGLVPFALAADGGGSIRVPASLCGCVGLMSTQCRLLEKGSMLSTSVTVSGAITNCVEDALLLYAIMADNPACPPITLPKLQAPPRPRALEGLKVGIYRKWYEDCSEEVLASCDRAVDTLRIAGAQVLDIVIPELELVRVAHQCTIGSEVLSGFRWAFCDGGVRRHMGHDVAISLRVMEQQSSTDYLQAQKIRTRITHHMERVFGQVHVVLTPTTPDTAPKFHRGFEACGVSDLPTTGNLMRFMQLANFAGLPAISVPCGCDSAGLPIGLHMMGPAYFEASLLAIANAFVRAGENALDLALREIQCSPLDPTGLAKSV